MKNANLSIDTKELLSLYLRQEFDQLSERFVQILGFFETQTAFNLDPSAQYFINLFFKTFLNLFSQPDYVLNERHIVRFIQFNPTISNLAALSAFKTTDAYLEILIEQPNNFAKLLTLYSARNTIKIDHKTIFDLNSQLASLWYSCFCETYFSGLVNKQVYENLKEHFDYVNDKLIFIDDTVYFAVSYINDSQDSQARSVLNSSIKKSPLITAERIENTPYPKKIAVITSRWFPGNSVYRTVSKFVESLKDDYEVTLIHLREVNKDFDTSPFKEVKQIWFEENALNLESLRQNNFMIAYYPDIGMGPDSILLSNLRIAPIQISGLGHPISTFGSEIDYFISGADVEAPDAESNYSERLILLPGLGIVHSLPSYQIRKIGKISQKFIINCSWSSQKINYPLVTLLNEIVKKSSKDVVFRFFSGNTLTYKNGFLSFAKDLESILGKEHIDLVHSIPHDEYMALMEEGDMCLDSYPFGGSNTIADSLYLRKPIVTFEGSRWYNRVGSQMLRLVGLEELVARNAEEYVSKALRLIDDDRYRLDIQERLERVDLNQTIFSTDSAKYFKKAIDFLIENHERLKCSGSRKPILIN